MTTSFALFTLISIFLVIKTKIKSSIKYAYIYFSLIIIFATLYHEFCPNLFKNFNKISSEDGVLFLKSILDFFKVPYTPSMKNGIFSLYYSVITITTLGFGDISPNSYLAIIITTIEAISGILFIGFFLNSLSQEKSEREALKKEEEIIFRVIEEEKKHEKEIILKYYSKLMDHYLDFHSLSKDIYYGPQSVPSFDENNDKINFLNNFISKLNTGMLLNLKEKCLIYKYANKTLGASLIENITTTKYLLNDFYFNYHFKHYTNFQNFFKEWAIFLEKVDYLNGLSLHNFNPSNPLKKMDAQSTIMHLSSLSTNDLHFGYAACHGLLYENIDRYHELIEMVESIKKS